MRNRFKSEKNWRLTKSCENYINFQVRKRNEHIDRMDFLEPQMLIFDLHWFTLGGALDFVREIEKALKNCKNKLIEHDEGESLSFDGRQAGRQVLMPDLCLLACLLYTMY